LKTTILLAKLIELLGIGPVIPIFAAIIYAVPLGLIAGELHPRPSDWAKSPWIIAAQYTSFVLAGALGGVASFRVGDRSRGTLLPLVTLFISPGYSSRALILKSFAGDLPPFYVPGRR